MTGEILILFALAAALAAVLVNLCIWSPGGTKRKAIALGTALMFLPVAYLSISQLPSRPKPVNIEWLQSVTAEPKVISSVMKEGEAIYLWLTLENVEEPRAYVIPWSDQAARQLHEAQRSAEAEGTQVRMRQPFNNDTAQQDPVFYADPQEPLPEKSTAAAAAN